MAKKTNDLFIYHKNDLSKYTKIRQGEVKIGESILTLQEAEDLNDLQTYKKKGVRYVLLGIPESAGVAANYGISGCEKGWTSFLKAFCNIQKNRFIDASKLLCLGHINTEIILNYMSTDGTENIDQLKNLCAENDEAVYRVVLKIFNAGMIPIVIGGGHNNAYPLLKAACEHYGKAVNCINLDPHADFRTTDGRHSGNPFSYAFKDGYLEKYAVCGLHKEYNPEYMLNEMDNNKSRIQYNFFDKNFEIENEISTVKAFFNDPDLAVGIELDMDSIAGMPASAFTPFGLSVKNAIQYIEMSGSAFVPAYLHLPEAAPDNDLENKIAGKILSYLIAAFVKK